MGIVVQKFGGTSLADSEKIKNVARAVIKEKENGNNVITIVSAMGHTTDFLIKLSEEVSNVPSAREMDMLLSTGEQVSASLLAMAIEEMGHPAISLNAWQVGIETEPEYSNARIIDIKTERLNKHLEEGKIIIITGFQGIANGDITTLGRGGSDTSAVAVAVAVKANRCDIYTDVEGVYTSDPRIVPNALPLKEISYEEMFELAHVGANVLHPRSVETAREFEMPMRVRSSFKLDNLGTLIIGVDKMEVTKPVTGVARDNSQVRVVICDVEDKPGNASKLFNLLAANNLSVDMIIQSYARSSNNTNDIAFTIASENLNRFKAHEEEIKSILNLSNIFIDENISKISIVGSGMIDRPGIAAGMFQSLAKAGINIKMIATSEIKISCLVDREDSEKAVVELCRHFELDGLEVAEVRGNLPSDVL
ncbi:aspartate kinase [bacterium]|nr:aspartate kinase [bacterium]